ncbi:hypothetical protein ASPZODRAFT_131644 [Penicilliopsis zonata CBS 506.65]|uniref:C2H2-type domain-containing protein n=1 Tax=Penicilliopsis zonata CBS 506.65 TaxID=1073090 RepID=A0A1L9SLS2_9EURO|nr:hypothetical protein ASPZODRAFT_131644 [Penicilliopsis zonata CBS 506.65]OJJ47997.1 hypothetical protein ASPZODRAFT_131644 [Penicilliopsis zonata CBS 506.65]
MSAYSMTESQYLPGQMHHHHHHPSYGWASRQTLPLQQTTPSLDHQHPLSQTHQYPSPSLSSGYNAQAGSHAQSYYPPGGSHYLPTLHTSSLRHNPSRSPPIIQSYPSTSVAGNSTSLAEHQQAAFVPSSPPYLLNQQEYYLPEPSTLPNSHSLTAPQHAPGLLPTTESIYSSPSDSAAPPTAPSEPEHHVRVISSRPRPQCWDHGCNGREFSTFSNLLRHQREKSGVVAKAECPICGAVFTRTTARNIHVAQGKCKGGAGRDPST